MNLGKSKNELVVFSTMWIERKISCLLQTMASESPVVLLTGARQTGKTSLLKKHFPNIGFVSLDLPSHAVHAEENGQDFLRRHPPPYCIDEVQYAPGVFRYLKAVIDQDRARSGQYLLTGSQKFPLMQGVSESLSGRAQILEVFPLSFEEILSSVGGGATRSLLEQAMFRGGYPELWAADRDPSRFYASYVATYLERDVRQVIQVRSLRTFERLLRLAAIRTGQLVSYTALATDLGISPTTVKEWLHVLEASSIVHFVEPYFENLGKRLIKTPKLYFTDTGLAAFLAGFTKAEDLVQSSLVGAFFETFVFGQLSRHFSNQGLQYPIYHYRDQRGKEIDFVVPKGNQLTCIECKWSSSPKQSMPVVEELRRGGVGGKEYVPYIACTVEQNLAARSDKPGLCNGFDWGFL